MTQLEDQLRLAFRAKASEITPPPPPLELQPRPVLDPAARGGSGRAGTSLQRRWLVPLAAAVAVLAVIAGALAVGNLHPAHRTRLVLPASAPIQTSVPPYYVSLTSVRPMPLRKPQAWPVLTTATVRATATGAVIASIVPPQPYAEFIDVSAAADDRYFVLVAQDGPGGGPGQDGFFLLHINPTAADPAARATITALPAANPPYDDEVQAMALSPNGRLLASVVQPRSASPGYLSVYNLATGRTRTWTGAYVNVQYVGEGSGGLAWTQDSRTLAVSAATQSDRLRLLHVTARGRKVTSGSGLLRVPRVTCMGYCLTEMTPDGRTVFVEYATGGTPGGPSWDNLVNFDVQTGALARISMLTVSGPGGRYVGYNPGADLGPDDVLWTSYNGSKVIVADVRPGVPNAGIYNGSHYTPIPWPSNIVAAAW
jgi:hypothetical protein